MLTEKQKRYLIYLLAASLLVMVAVFITMQTHEPTLTERLSDLLEQQFDRAQLNMTGYLAGELLHADTLLHRFYQQREFQPAWFDDYGPRDIADSLALALREADLDGLNPNDYHSRVLDSLLTKARTDLKMRLPVPPTHWFNIEVLLTDAFLVYSNHLLAGRLDPETIAPEWLSPQPEHDLIALLNQAIVSQRIQGTLRSLLPNFPCYAKLRSEMALYKSIAPKDRSTRIPPGEKMKPGDRGQRVAALSERLILYGDLTERPTTFKYVYDDTLAIAVRRFQERSGLKIDGEVGAGTLAALNMSAAEQIRKIAVNMERWRWLPQQLGDRYLLVNIAAFNLDVVEHGQTILSMPVVVGKDYRQTPVFSSRMTYLVFNPFWHVPPTIATEDILPEAKKNPQYLVKRKIEVLRSWNDQTVLDPFSINWAAYSKDNLPFVFRQPPGRDNALGRIKFMFPNKYDVYIHDTPQRSHFSLPQRAYSSGCIRVESPLDLATYVLKDDPQWTREAIIAALDTTRDFVVKLPHPIQVHIFYCTSYVDERGWLHFREDIYQRDAVVAQGLQSAGVLLE
jgi:murein L,D-transpeptidase YcbB/YkuD